MDAIINLQIPHLGEEIFKGLGLVELIQYQTVSKSWKVLIENVLSKKVLSKRLVERYKNNVNAVFEHKRRQEFQFFSQASAQPNKLHFGAIERIGETF